MHQLRRAYASDPSLQSLGPLVLLVLVLTVMQHMWHAFQVKKRKAAQAGLQKERMLLEKKIKKKRADADTAVRTPCETITMLVQPVQCSMFACMPRRDSHGTMRTDVGAESGHGQDAGGDGSPVAEAEDGGGGAGHQAVAGAAAGSQHREAAGAAPGDHCRCARRAWF